MHRFTSFTYPWVFLSPSSFWEIFKSEFDIKARATYTLSMASALNKNNCYIFLASFCAGLRAVDHDRTVECGVP